MNYDIHFTAYDNNGRTIVSHSVDVLFVKQLGEYLAEKLKDPIITTIQLTIDKKPTILLKCFKKFPTIDDKKGATCCGGVPLVNGRCPICGGEL